MFELAQQGMDTVRTRQMVRRQATGPIAHSCRSRVRLRADTPPFSLTNHWETSRIARNEPVSLRHEAATETVCDRLSTIADAEFTEQPPGMRLHSVLGEIQLTSDLAVALALAHAAQHL